jgi:cytochrome c oxidase assembly protein Cox11
VLKKQLLKAVAFDVLSICMFGVDVSVIPLEPVTCHRVGVTCTHVTVSNGFTICTNVVPSKKVPVAGDIVRE